MKTHQWGLGCWIVLAAMMLVSCAEMQQSLEKTKSQMQQAIQNATHTSSASEQANEGNEGSEASEGVVPSASTGGCELQTTTASPQQTKAQDQPKVAQQNESASSGNAAPANTVKSPSGGNYVPLKAADFPERGRSLLDQYVEISGNMYSSTLIDPKSDFSHGEISDPSVDPRAMDSPKVDVVFNMVDREAISWMAKNMCREICKNVFVRGRLVMRKGHRQPVLEMTQISFESVTGAEAGGSVEAKRIAAQDRYGIAKPVLASGTVPTEACWRGWAERVPPTAPGYDAAKGMWKSMVDYSDYKRQSAWDDQRGIVRGPDRPETFETYYRGVRDTGLSNLFKSSPFSPVQVPLWPRVVLIMEERPKGGVITNNYNSGGGSDRCWRLRAKVWTGPARSEDIAPFNWCLSEMRFNVGYQSVINWGMTPKSSMMRINASTGKQRTIGPTPPGTPLPQPAYNNASSYSTIMVGNVLMDMGFSFHVPDGRVWLIDERSIR